MLEPESTSDWNSTENSGAGSQKSVLSELFFKGKEQMVIFLLKLSLLKFLCGYRDMYIVSEVRVRNPTWQNSYVRVV